MMISEMKKLISISSALGSLFVATTAFAQNAVNFTLQQPNQGIAANTDLGTIIRNILTIVFSIAVLLVLFYLILGAFEWITSGGEKEGVGKARGKIINALIGLAILALAFLIVRIAGQLVNVNVFNLSLPALGPAPTPGVNH